MPLAQASPSGIDDLIDDAQAKLQAGDDAGALAVLARAAKVAPRDPRPRYLSGAALAHEGKRPEAIAAWRSALALDDRLPAVHNELGIALEDSGDLAGAAREFRSATSLDRSVAASWLNLGRVLARAGDHAAAAAALAEGSKAVPRDADLRIDLSIALRHVNKPDEAVAVARQAVALAPTAAARINLGLSLQHAGKLDEAARELGAGVKLDAGSVGAWWALGQVERDRKQWPAAITALERARQLKESPAIVSDLIGVLRASGDLERAQSTLGAALEKSPRSLALHVELVRMLVARKRCDGARAELAKLPADKVEVISLAAETKRACP